jgi:hypothetical protein
MVEEFFNREARKDREGFDIRNPITLTFILSRGRGNWYRAADLKLFFLGRCPPTTS